MASRTDLRAPTTLRVFSSDGTYEGTVVLPGRFMVYDSGPAWLLGVMRDENEVEFVQLHER